MAKQNADGHIYAIRIAFGFSETMELFCLPIQNPKNEYSKLLHDIQHW